MLSSDNSKILLRAIRLESVAMLTLGMVCCDVDSSYFSLKCEPNSQFEPRGDFSLKCEPDLHSKSGGSDAGIPLLVFSERFRGPDGPDLQEIEEGK